MKSKAGRKDGLASASLLQSLALESATWPHLQCDASWRWLWRPNCLCGQSGLSGTVSMRMRSRSATGFLRRYSKKAAKPALDTLNLVDLVFVIYSEEGSSARGSVVLFTKAEKLGTYWSTVRIWRCGAMLGSRLPRQDGLKNGVTRMASLRSGAWIRFIFRHCPRLRSDCIYTNVWVVCSV